MGSNVTLHAEGSPICSFQNSAETPIRSLRAYFAPTQSGSGDPSPENVREINGWNELQVWKTGKNLLNQQLYQYTSAVLSFGGNTTGTTDGTLALAAGTYTFSTNAPEGTIGIYKKGGSFVQVVNQSTTATFTIAEDTDIGIMMLSFSTEAEALSYNYQLEVGSVATTYEPYKGQIIPITFPALGKNKLNPSWENGQIVTGTGQPQASTNSIRLTNKINVIPGKTYVLSWASSNRNIYRFAYKKDGTFSRYLGLQSVSGSSAMTFQNDECYLWIYQWDNTTPPENMQLELGSTATTYEAYSSNNTVCGGYIDVASGELVKTWTVRPISEFQVTKTPGSGVWEHRFDLRAPWITGVGYEDAGGQYQAICSCFAQGSAETNFTFRTYAGLVDVYDDTTETAEDFQTKYGNYTIAYAIRPQLYQTYHLTPIQISTLLNQNHIWSSTDNKVEVDYDLHETRIIQSAKRRIAANEPHLETKSGAIASFETDLKAPIKQIKCEFAPVQDFNGYGKPWPAGGGTNVWDEETVLGYVWAITGTAGYNVGEYDPTYTNQLCSKNYIPIKPETSYYAVSPETIQIVYYDSNKDYLGYKSWFTGAFTTPANAAYMKFNLGEYGETYNNDVAINYPSTVTTYSPYENICPISGWTGANIYCTDKSIVNFKVNTFTNQNQSQYNGNVGWCDNLYHLSAYAGKTVTYSVDIDATNATSDNNAARIWAKDKEGNWKYLATTGTYINAGTSGRSSISVAITDDIDWIVFGLWLQTNATASNPMVELGSMATEYKDYEGTTIPVTFPATKNLFNPNAEFFSSSAYKWFRFINSDEICNMSFTLKDSSVDLTGLYIGFAYTTENIELGYRWVINNGVVQNYKKNIPSQDGDKRCQYIVYYPSANSTLETILSAYDIQVEQGSTATAYEPYGTIYGGYVDLVKGELVQTYYKLVADGVNLKVNSYYSNITDLIGGGIVYLNPVGMAAGASGPNGQPPNVFCDSIPLFTQSYVGFHPQEPPFATAVQGGKQYIIIYPAKLSDHPEVTDATTAKAFVNNWLQSNPVTIIYELVEPIIYQLTPTQLKSLKGTNNIWSNTNGNTTVTYWTH